MKSKLIINAVIFWSELYMAEVLIISNSIVPTCKFEVLIAQPLPKLAMATRSPVTGSPETKPCFPPSKFKYYIPGKKKIVLFYLC